MNTEQRCLLDVNVLVALLDEFHVHHKSALKWFKTPGRQWALCPFSEAGFLRIVTNPRVGMSMETAETLLEGLRNEPGYHYQLIPADWLALTKPFRSKIHGHNQVTDAWLLGMALHAGLMLVTFDRGMLHMAGEHRGSVVVLEGN